MRCIWPYLAAVRPADRSGITCDGNLTATQNAVADRSEIDRLKRNRLHSAVFKVTANGEDS